MALGFSAITAALLVGLAVPALAEGDAAAGEKVFNKCKACHMIGDGAKNRVGPNLTGIVDEEIASNPDFNYSDAFMEKKGEGVVWTDEVLHEYLTSPKDFAPGTKMTFAGLKKEKDRDDVVAYLMTFE
jgi:cytochrome c